MRKNIVSLILVVIGLSLAGYIYQKSNIRPIISPVLGEYKIASFTNIWYPKDAPKTFNNAPLVSAQAAFFVETTSGEIFYEKNSTQRLSIASLVKIMTAILTLENRELKEQLSVSQKAASMEPDKMFLIPQEKLTVKELLEGLFLVSANDAAEVLAEGVTGRREEFINLMNAKAKSLGLNDTLFLNPSGLEEDGQTQYSTALDVALMSRYAIKRWPELIDISSKEHIYIPKTNTHQDYDLYSGINLLTTYPGVVGFKTGFTPEAGLTLVTLARREGKEVLGVLLNAESRRDDAKALLDYSFSKLGI